jgi:hypothetical protein
MTVMHQTGSVITGSYALNILLGDSYDSSTSDLNLIIPRGNVLKMTTYLQQQQRKQDEDGIIEICQGTWMAELKGDERRRSNHSNHTIF